MKKVKQIKYLDFPKEVRERKKEYFEAIERVLYSGWYILGQEVESFEKEFACFLETKYCVGVGNGLEALQISLMALGIGGEDEVITTPISAVATILAIMAIGAKPTFVDTLENGQINHDLIEKAITKKTKAVLPVHLYGQPVEIAKIKSLCKKHKFFLIEDAAQAHGSTFKGKKLGSFGDINCFSFYPTKNLGVFGDGGAIVTNNSRLAKISREIRDYGQQSKYVHKRYGLNSRLDEIHAATLRVKLRYLKKDNQERRKIAKRYIKVLSKIKQVKTILPKNLEDSNFHLFVIKTDKRNELKDYLKDNGIPSLIHYPIAIPDQPLFGGKYKNLDLPVARKFVKEVLSLPCYPRMPLADVDYITDTIKAFWEKN